MRQSGLSTVELERFQTVRSGRPLSSAGLRGRLATLAANNLGSLPWAYGISGDYPILLVRIASEEGLGVVRELLQAHAYWRKRGVTVDLAT